MIAELLVLLLALAACVAAGVIFTLWRHENERAELRAEEARVAENQEYLAALASIHARSRGRREPSGVDPFDHTLT
jgi:Tfp pilus assembly protein PilO